ncbi:PREDICTED: uncharacterized protein LOC109235265 [Nicotiana attenuata]|uniref:uncharacterized protein LOC109235265 n=1 Tax=Nicotiana attenuata TaxID=49451 RepID=UPI0009058E7A|nr:PREDICTED: uncharacterized protein LOC109235265 [Nicotiana attenuata]
MAIEEQPIPAVHQSSSSNQGVIPNHTPGIDYNHPLFLSPLDVYEDGPGRKNKLDMVDGTCSKENFPENLTIFIKIATLSQVTASMSVYFSKLKDLWEEFEALVPAPGCHFPKSRDFVVHLQKLKLCQFLMGLNDSYNQTRSQILLMSLMPTINQAYAMVISDESQKSVAATTGLLGANLSTTTRHYDIAMYTKTGASATPPSANAAGIPCALLASNSLQDWIIDTGATNPMVADLELLNKASLVQTGQPKKVYLPNGETTQVTHIRTSTISYQNTITNVFYIPQFKYNLLSVSKVIKEMKYSFAFFSDFCIFQELFSGRVKAIGKEDSGLYILSRQKYKE